MSQRSPQSGGRTDFLSAPVHRIAFDVAEPVVEGCEGGLELVILVDGTPLFAPEGEIMGVDPDELFGPGNPLCRSRMGGGWSSGPSRTGNRTHTWWRS